LDGLEVTEEVFDQDENTLYTIKEVMVATIE
jgi:ornithine carbamoyltransferase